MILFSKMVLDFVAISKNTKVVLGFFSVTVQQECRFDLIDQRFLQQPHRQTIPKKMISR